MNARAIFAAAVTAMLTLAAVPATADTPSVGVSFEIGPHRNDTARCVNPVRISMYAAQAADALTAGAAASHNGVSRTPFGLGSTVGYMAEQAALDVLVGALTRRWSCGSKNAVDGAIGASAAANAFQNGASTR